MGLYKYEDLDINDLVPPNTHTQRLKHAWRYYFDFCIATLQLLQDFRELYGKRLLVVKLHEIAQSIFNQLCITLHTSTRSSPNDQHEVLNKRAKGQIWSTSKTDIFFCFFYFISHCCNLFRFISYYMFLVSCLQLCSLVVWVWFIGGHLCWLDCIILYLYCWSNYCFLFNDAKICPLQ